MSAIRIPHQRHLPEASRTRLIKFVKAHECLYDQSHQDYYNKVICEPLWTKIGAEIGVSGIRARMQWKNLRDGFRVQKKKRDQGKYRTQWIFWDLMSFIEPHLTYRGTWEPEQSSGPADLPDHHTEELELNPTSPKEVIEGWTVKLDQDAANDTESFGDSTQDNKTEDFVNEIFNSNSPSSSDTNTLKPVPSNSMPKKRWMTDVEMCQIVPAPAPSGVIDTEPIVNALREIGTGLNRAVQDYQDEEAAYGLYIAAKMRSIPSQDRQRIKLQIEQMFTDIQYSAE